MQSSADRTQLALSHLPFASDVATRLGRRFRPLLDLRDARALAIVGLCEAAESCRDDGEFALTAASLIRAWIMTGLPTNEPRGERRTRLRAIGEAEQALLLAGEEPTHARVAALLQLTRDEIDVACSLPGEDGVRATSSPPLAPT